MRRVVGDGARPDGGRHRVGRSRHHRHRLAEAELRPGSGGQRAEHRVGAEQLGELIAPQPGQAQQVVVVADPRRVARIGHPVQRCGDARRREPAGELEPQPVDRLQEPHGGAVYLRTLGAQPEDVPDWVPPRQRRRAARAPHPERELAGVIARDAQPAAGEPPHVGRAAGVQPDDRGAQRQPCRVDRHGPSPLRGDRDGAHRVALGRAVRQHAAGGGHRRRPPVARALLGAPARLQQQRNALERGRDDLAFAAHHPHLRAARTQVDRQDAAHEGIVARSRRRWKAAAWSLDRPAIPVRAPRPRRRVATHPRRSPSQSVASRGSACRSAPVVGQPVHRFSSAANRARIRLAADARHSVRRATTTSGSATTTSPN